MQAKDIPLSHVDSTSSRVFDRQQGAIIPQQTAAMGRQSVDEYGVAALYYSCVYDTP